MKLAVFTDIHGNLEALKTIINDIKSKNVDEIICLGDTIGLGSESKECLDLIIENNIKMVLGNHELCALYGTDIDSSINSNVQKEHYKWIRESLTTKEIDFLKKCPLYYECNISYNNIIKNKKIIFSHYLLEDTSKLYPFEKNNLKNDVNLWIKYNNEEEKKLQEEKRLIFSTSLANPTKAKIIGDMDSVPYEYYDTVLELINNFISGKNASGELKRLKSNKKLVGFMELKYDQVRIVFKHIKNNIYNVVGVFTKKANNDMTMYQTMANRMIPDVTTEEKLNKQLELGEITLKQLTDLVEVKRRKGTR